MQGCPPPPPAAAALEDNNILCIPCHKVPWIFFFLGMPMLSPMTYETFSFPPPGAISSVPSSRGMMRLEAGSGFLGGWHLAVRTYVPYMRRVGSSTYIATPPPSFFLFLFFPLQAPLLPTTLLSSSSPTYQIQKPHLKKTTSTMSTPEVRNFEPKEAVNLLPPKTDPITVAELAKCDGRPD